MLKVTVAVVLAYLRTRRTRQRAHGSEGADAVV